MNMLEKKMLESLNDLRENYNVIGVKAEFEAEGTRKEEALRLKEIVTKANLDLTIKIGGCEAVKDTLEAKVIGVRAIVAPMIETAYAMKKFVKTVRFAFDEDEISDVDFLINIETKTGFSNLDEIIDSPEFDFVSGVVLGRVDMTGSMGMSRSDIETDPIFDMADKISLRMRERGKKFVVGGGVSANSIPFFKKLNGRLDKYETRKVIFDARKCLASENVADGLIKAVGFELNWLKNKRNFYGMIHKEDAARIEMIEARYMKLLERAQA